MRGLVLFSLIMLAACGSPQSGSKGPFAGFAPLHEAKTPATTLTDETGDDQAVPVVDNSKPESPIKAFWEGLWHDGRYVDHPEWTQATVTALQTVGAGLVQSTPRDVQDFCPNYANLDARGRMAFWVELISSIALPESDYNPKSSMVEKLKSGGKNSTDVVSSGLMSLSLGDRAGFGCAISSEADLNDPVQNLTCAVKVMNQLVTQSQVISATGNGKDCRQGWLGGACYWSVLRSTSKHFAGVRNRVASGVLCTLPMPAKSP